MFVAALATPSPALAALQDNTVRGVAPRGTTINLFDYWLTGQTESDKVTTPINNNDGINLDHALKFGKGMGTEAKDVTDASSMNKWTGSARPRYGIVENKLGSDGYPVLNQDKVGTNESLAYLFDLSAQEGKAAYSDVKNLLQVDQQGYYYCNSQKNFAQFNEETKDFTLYNTWGVRNDGASPQGQFFPFNTGEQVYDETADGGITQKGSLTSTNEAIRHYFGVSMSTRFVQRYDGYTTENQELPVTYNFSGDDDVWIFIDDVLVADLGGIHDMTSVQINFVSGEVITYQDKDLSDSYTEGDLLYIKTTLAKIFRDAGVSAAMKDETFANDTYHTLDFFYLERGNTDSNMSLKYNLVTIPETEIQKVDQVGKPLSNVTFEVYDATVDEETNKENGTLLCTSTTDRTGNVVLLDENEFPITLEQLWNKGVKKIKLVETNTPEGHRSVSPIMLNLDRRLGPAQKLYSTIVTSEDPWTTGAYALSKVTTTTADTIMVNGQALTEDQIQNGMLFVVIEKYLKDEDEWRPVYGDPIRGWTVLEDDSEASILAAAQQTNSVFTIASSGAYETEIDDLPGDTLDYTFFDGDDENDNGQLYRGVYYYTAAPLNDWAAAAEKGIYQIENSNDFPRQFSARLYVSNILNRFIVQKLSEDGTALDGAVFALYDEDSAEEKNDEWVLKTDAEPLATAEPTRTLTSDNDSVDLEGATIFTNLEPGVYWLHEETAPEGYLKNDRLTKVIVTDTGVYADAGVTEDGIEVSRGVGRLVKSMVQFAVADDIDASLYDIVATPYLGTVDENGVISWSDDPAADALHLHYKDGATAVFDYLAEENSEQYFRTDTGIANLTIAQCPTHGTEHGYRQDLTGKDLTNLYTGVTVVHVTDASEPTLTVSKDVKNAPADELEKSFQFQIALKDADGNLLEGTFDAQVYAKATDGGEDTPLGTSFKISSTPQAGESQNTFELKDNEYLLVSGLPTGARYEVTERHDEDYVSSVAPTTTVDTNSEDGLTADGSLKPGNSTVAFTNLYFNSDEAKDVSTVDNPTTSIDGQLVGVGDTLHYTVDWVNTALDEKGAPAKATVTVTDVVPDGTELVEDSISDGGSYNPDNRTITWTFEDQDPGATGTVSFDVTVLDSAAQFNPVSNTATIKIGDNGPVINTNMVTNPVPSKTVEEPGYPEGGIQVGDTLTFVVTWENTNDVASKVTITDTLPKSLTYAGVPDGAREPQVSEEGVLVWDLGEQGPGAKGSVTFKARVNENALTISTDNEATVKVGDNEHKTNLVPGEKITTGELNITKNVKAEQGAQIDEDKSFSISVKLTAKDTTPLSGTYTYTIGDGEEQQLTLTDGSYTFELKHGESVRIVGLPQGATYAVTEANPGAGYTPSYENQNGTITDTPASVTVTNTYSPGTVTFDPSGKHAPAVTKVVTGNGSADEMSPAGYTFELSVKNITSADTDPAAGVTPTTLTGTSDADGNVTFDSLTLSEVGTYEVTIREIAGANDDVTYDGHTFSYKLDVMDNGSGTLIASVVGGSEQGSSTFTNVFFDTDDAKDVSEQEGSPSLDGDMVGVGDTLHYTVDWVNNAVDKNGAPTKASVTVTDTLPEHTSLVEGSITAGGSYNSEDRTITWNLGEKNPGATGTVSFDVTVDSSAASTTVENEATINVGEHNPEITTNTVTNPVPGKDVETDGQVGEGSILHYAITFTNTDGEGASATVVDTMTKGQEYVDDTALVTVGDAEPVAANPSSEGDAANGQTLTWQLRELPANAQVTITFDARVTRDAGATVDNSATVNDHKTNVTTLPYAPDDQKDVFEVDAPTTSVNGQMVGVGDELIYTIDWAAEEDGDLTITDPIPEGTSYVEGSADKGGVYSTEQNQITWTFEGVKSGDKGTVSFKVTVDEDAVTVDTVHNVATITVGENSKQVETTNTVPEKTFEDGTPSTGLQVGDVLTYTIEWANTTGAPATVVVTDHLPAGLTYVEDSAGELATYDAGAHTLTWDLGTQPDGAEGTVSFEAKVNEDATKVEDPLTNTGYVKVGDNHTYQTNTTEGDPKTGDLTVTKTVTSADPSLTPNPDQAFTFTITVKDAAGTPLSGAYTAKTSAGDEQVTFANGVVTTSLKDGESYTITDLPEGAHYTVAENNYADEGFTTSSDNEQGTITEDGATASFTNAYAAKTVDAKLGVTKTVTGAPAPEDFTFSLAFDEDNEGLTEGVTGLDGNTATVSKDELTLAEGASQASASANFGALTFSKPGTYTFKIVETNNAAPVGWTYDQIARTVTVRIDDNGQGKLSVGEIQYYDANGKPATGAVFTNSYVPSGVTVGDDEDSLMVTKQVEGAPTEESFNFTLKLTSDNAASVEGLGQDGTLSVSTDKSFSPSATQADTQTLDFGELTFTAVGTYTFEVTETNQAPEGTSWTYDNATPRTITVTVTDVDFDGQLDATVEGNNPVFINRFAAAGELPLSVTKVLDGRDWMADDPATADVDEKDVFTFNLTAADDVTSAAIEQGFVTLPAGATDLTISTDTPEHTATFGSIAFTKPGEYQFNVTEEQGSIGGITYDTESKLVKVDVADNGNGTLTATVTEGATNNTVTITNTYGTVPGTEEPVETAEFGLTKVFTGKAWEDETFAFTIAPAEGMPADTPMPENTTATVSSDTEDGRIDFGSITYKAEGTYVYTITEEKAGTTEGGITYDDNVATVTVQVSDDLQGGFAHTVQVTGGQQTFTNTYKTELSYDAEGGLRLVKELTGHDIDEGAFSYVVKPVASQTVSAEDAAARFGIEGEKNVAFEPATMDGATGVATSAAQLITGATFTQEDSGKTFVYEVSELQPETVPAGYTYDASVYMVSVAVADDGAGTLTVTTTVTNEAGEVVSEAVYTNGEDEVTPATVTFKNSYDAAGALGKASITATKQLNGGELAGGDFTFELRAADGTVLQTVENAQDGSIVFDEIGYSTQSLLADVAAGRATYNAADDTYHYTYEIAEVTDGLAEEGVTPVVTTGTVTVTVTDNGDGTLSATVDASNKPVVLVNDYGTVDEGSALVGISGKKVLTAEDGLNPPEIDGAFEFTITGTTVSGTQNPAPLPEKTTVTNDASGAVSFGTIEYTIENVFGDAQGEDGISTLSVASRTAVFEYTVTEGEKTLDGVTNDPESTRTFTVVVTDNGDGTMTATDEAGNAFDGTALFEFVNTYAVEKEPSSPTGEGGISITKNLEVLAGDREMSAGEFTFVMTETTDPEAEEPARYYATNEADGTVNFEEITFTEPGVYTYIISEVIPVNANGVTYDTASYTATATVTDLRNGHLGVAWSFADADGAPVEEIVFNNVYDIEQPAEVTFGATKVLAGRDLTDGEFTFELKDAEGNVIQTATNTADGKVVFAPVQIDEIGEFTYTVSEVLPQDDDPETAGIQKDDVTYDETVYTATVTVTDTHLGTYDLELSYDREGTLPSFHNTYVEPPAPEQPGTPGEPGTPGTPGQPIPSTGDPSVVIPAIAAALAGTGLVGITLAGRRRRG